MDTNNELQVAKNVLGELRNDMRDVSQVLYSIGSTTGDVNTVVKANVVNVLATILADDEIGEFHEFLKLFVAKTIFNKISINELIHNFNDTLSDDFKSKALALEAFKADFNEIGVDGFNEVKDDIKKNHPGFNIDGFNKEKEEE